MTLQDFMKKYAMSRMKLSGPAEGSLLMNRNDGEEFSSDDAYEFYANAEKTLWVSVNRTRRRFRLCFHDHVQALGIFVIDYLN